MKQLSVYLERDPLVGSSWKVRRIDGIEVPSWQEGPGYSDLDIYCAKEIKSRNWSAAGVDTGDCDASITFWKK